MARTSFQYSHFMFMALALVSAPAGLCAADGVKFETMAPKGSALVISAKDVNATAARIDASPLGQIWMAPEIASIVSQARKESAQKRAEALQKLGVDADEVPLPGPMGVSIFIERNEELDAPEIGVLLWADYAQRADVAGKIFDGIIRDLEKKAGKPFEQIEIEGGAKAMRVVLPSDPVEADPQDPQPPQRRRPRGVDALGAITALPEALYFIRIGSQFFAASSISSLEEAITAASGKTIPCIADTEDWRGITSLVGDQDVSIILLTAPIQELLTPVFAGPMAPAQVAIKDLFGDIRGWALTMGGNNDQAILDVAVSAYIPGAKIGLMDILSDATPIEPPLALLGDDAVTYQRLNVRFGSIMAMIEDVVASLPEYMADSVSPMLQQYGAGMTKAFASLGPDVSTVSRKAPDGVEGMRTFTAIRCKDEKTTNALLATILPAAGMMPRDFQGQIVYGGEGLGIEIGLGGGALVMGADEAVEQALRSAGDPLTKSLAENALYRQCLSALTPGSVVGWGYADVPTLLDQNRKALLLSSSAASSAADENISAPAADGDSLDMLVPVQFDPAMRLAYEKIDQALLRRYFGPLVWDIRSETKGLKVHGLWLRAIEPVK